MSKTQKIPVSRNMGSKCHYWPLKPTFSETEIGAADFFEMSINQTNREIGIVDRFIIPSYSSRHNKNKY